MDKATIEKLDSLRMRLYEAERRLGWLAEGGKEIYADNKDEDFFISVSRSSKGGCAFQMKISFAEVDRMYQTELSRLTAERDEIQRQIDEL